MAAKLKTAILGATGYSGFELARILLRHPGVETPVMLQRSGESAAEANLGGHVSRHLRQRRIPAAAVVMGRIAAPEIELLFLATPHEVSRALVPEAIGPWLARGGPQRRLAVAAGAKPRRLWFS